jgi:hypothetical protein
MTDSRTYEEALLMTLARRDERILSDARSELIYTFNSEKLNGTAEVYQHTSPNYEEK